MDTFGDMCFYATGLAIVTLVQICWTVGSISYVLLSMRLAVGPPRINTLICLNVFFPCAFGVGHIIVLVQFFLSWGKGSEECVGAEMDRLNRIRIWVIVNLVITCALSFRRRKEQRDAGG
eukprot:SAG22_NODE_6166_length_891_cov_0.882576_2_plen_119_part_01